MKDENIEKGIKEIRVILNKYEFKSVVLGFTADDRFVGTFCVEREKGTFEDGLTAFANTARLYQSAREKVLGMFDQLSRSRK